nr:hypothetical protein REQ54_04087 [Rhizobium sp. Q54]
MAIEDSRVLAAEVDANALRSDEAVFEGQTDVPDAPVVLAQAADLTKTDRLPGSEQADNRYRVENGMVQLPAGMSLDDMRVDGNDLILVQADGTEIVILDGALKIPTLIVGDVELSQQVLFAALEDSGINVAAGPDGSYGATGTPPSSGADFETIEQRQAENIALAELLGDTSFGDSDGFSGNGVDDGEPSILSPLTQPFILDEAVIADGVSGNQSISGRLPFEQGPDFGTITLVTFTGATNLDEEGAGLQALAGFTSGGSPITVTSFPAPSDGSALNFVAIEGRDANGNLVFQLTIDNRITGDFTFELIGKLDHADAGQDSSQVDLNDLLRLGFTYTVMDLDGDFVTGSFNIDVMDDGPVAYGSSVSVNADEDDILNALSQGTSPDGDSDLALLGLGLAATVRGSVGSVVAFGADGAAAAGGFSLTSTAVSTMAGLGLTSKGATLSYQVFGNSILAFVNNGGLAGYQVWDRPVFSLELNPVSGNFEYRQYEQLDHVDGNGENTVLKGTSPIDGINFGAIINATDGDGDIVNLTGKLTIKVVDDIPEVIIVANRSVAIDETAGNQNDDTTRLSVSNLFNGVTNKGSDGDMPRPAYAQAEVIDTGYERGADENVTTSLTLQIDDANSGLTTTDGRAITLSLENGIIVGRVAGGEAAFAVTITPNGNVSVAQYMSLKHPNTGSHDEGINLAGKISAVFSVTDHDKDTVTKSVSIGNRITFEDDGPTVGDNGVIQLDDDALSGGNLNGTGDDLETTVLSGVLSHSGGADGTASVLWASNGVTVPSTFLATASPDGKVMTITQDQDGQTVAVVRITITNPLTGAYTIEQLAPVKHPQGTIPGTEDNVRFTVSYDVTDKDGDVTRGTFSLEIDDDTPTVGDNAVIQLDDDALSGGNPGGIGDDAETAGSTGVLAHSGGADGTASVLWSPVGLDLQPGFWYVLSDDHQTMTITQQQNGVYVPIFEAVVTNTLTGAYKITQLNPVMHDAGAAENNKQVSFQYRVTDGDNDVETGTLTVNMDDDTPTGGAGTTVWLDDDTLSGGNPGGDGDRGLTNTSNVLKHSFGADGPGGIAWTGITVTNGGDQADFTSSVSTDGKTLQVFQSGTLVITAVLNPLTGQYTLTQNAPIDHVTGGNENEIQFKFNYDVTDGDGDVAPGYIWVNVDDDTPTGGAGTTAWLNDDTLSGGNPGGDGDRGLTNTSNVLKHSFGADGPGGIAWTGITVTNGGDQADFTSSVSTDGKTLQVFQSGTLVITAVLNPLTGQYTLTQNAPIDHVTGGNENEIQFKFNYDVTDGDGDVAPGYIWVNVDDDTPTGGAGTTAWLNDDTLSGGNPGGDGDRGLTNTSNVLKHSFGADGPGGIAWTGITVTNGGDQADFTSSVSTDGKTLQVFQSGTLVITAVLNPLTGQYTLTQNAPIDHVTGGNENEIQFKFNYDVTDGDGDVAPGYIWVNVDDDTPTGGAGTTAWLNDDTLSGGNPGGDGDRGLTNTSNVLKHSFGADGPGGIAWTGITVTNGGDQADFTSSVSTDGKTLQVFQSGTLVITAVLNPLTGQYTLTQNAPIDHVTGGNENEIQFKFNYDVTDGDGDVAPGYIWVNVDDDTPTGGAGTTAWLNDDTLSGGNPGGDGDRGLTNTSNVLKHSFGADGPGGIAWTGITVTNGGDQADFTSSVSTDGKTLQVFQSGTLVITAVLNPLTGQYTLTQNAPIDHVTGGNENEIQFKFNYDVTDGDGDVAPGYIWVNVDDDTPTASYSGRLTLVEDANASTSGFIVKSAEGQFKFDAGADGAKVTSIAYGFAGSVINDPDQPGFTTTPLTSGGQVITVANVDGDPLKIEGKLANGTVIFTVEVTNPATGAYKVTQLGPIDHPEANVTGADDPLRMKVNFTVTDGDGDTASNSIQIDILDDVPVQNATRERGRVDEDDLQNYRPISHALGWPIEGSNGTSPDQNTSWSGGAFVQGSVADLVDFGADGPAAGGGFSFAFKNHDEASLAVQALALTSKGEAVNAARIFGDWILGGTDDRIVFAMRLESDGGYRFVLLDQVDHNVGDNPDTGRPEAVQDAIRLDLSSWIKATDGDNDTLVLDQGSMVIRVRDDVPVAVGTEHRSLSENDLANLNPLYPVLFDIWQGSLGTSPYDGPADGITGLFGTVPVWGSLADNIKGGADEGGQFHLVSEQRAENLLASLGQSGYLESKGEAINGARMITIPGIGDVMGFFAEDDRLVFGLFVSENGIYNFRLFDQLDHPQQGADALELDLSRFVNYTDFDGDTINLGRDIFVITVNDDIPVVRKDLALTLKEADLGKFFILDDEISTLLQALGIGSQGTEQGPDGFADQVLGTTSTQGLLNEIIGDDDLVDGGADEVGRFGLISANEAEAILVDAGWKSKGEAIDTVKMVQVDGIGQAMGFFAGDRLVLTIALSNGPFGAYDVRVWDQFDHAGHDNPTTAGIETAFADTLSLNIGQFITYTDADDDKISLGGNITLDLVDDIPVIRKDLTLTLKEADLGKFFILDDEISTLLQALGIGSQGTEQDPDGFADQVFGTTSTQGLLNEIIGNDDLVDGGADEVGRFGLISANEAEAILVDAGWKSKGEAIDTVKMVQVDGIGQAMGFFAGDRLVLTIALSNGPFGAYDVRVWDQFDHAGHDNPTTAGIETAFADTLSLNIGQFITYTDADGDKTSLGGHIRLDVVDDVPVVSQQPVLATVEEEHDSGLLDLLGQVLGIDPGNYAALIGDMDHGNEDTAGLGDLDTEVASLLGRSKTASYATGSLHDVIKGGADESGRFSFREVSGTPVKTSTGEVLKSHGASVHYTLTSIAGIPVLVGYVNSSSLSGGYDFADRMVFSLILSDIDPLNIDVLDPFDSSLNDNFIFIQHDQFDNPPPSGGAVEDTLSIDLSEVIRYTDADGDIVDLPEGAFVIGSIDDIPVQVEGAQIVGVVEEEQLFGGVEDTSSDPDLDSDTSTSGSDANRTTHTVSGDLRALVEVGADEVTNDVTLPLVATARGKFSFGETSNMPNLTSNGHPVLYKIIEGDEVDKLVGYIEVGGSEQPIFTLSLRHTPETFTIYTTKAAGEYTFTLSGQIDHQNGATPGVEDVLPIDFSSVISFSDYDGDTITLNDGSFVIKVIDDVPTAAISAVGTVTLDESALPAAGDPNAATDDTTTAPFAGYGAAFGVTSSTLAVSHASNLGADKEGASRSFALTNPDGSQINGTVTGMETVAGKPILLFTENGLVVGRETNASGNVVFIVGIDGSGKTTIAQYLPIKHSDTSSLDEVTGGLVDNIHVTVTVTDGDGDVAKATSTQPLKIVFEDDGPAVDISVTGSSSVDPGASVTGTWNPDFGRDGIGSATVIVVGGTDYQLDTDIVVAGKGTLRVETGGTWTFTALNAAVAGTVEFGLKVTDGDGDTATKAQVISVSAPLNSLPMTSPDFVVTNQGRVSVPDWVLLLNDRDPDGDPIWISGANSVSGGLVSHADGSVVFDDGLWPAAGTFEYTLTDGTGSKKETVTVTRDYLFSLDGSSKSEIVIDGGGGTTIRGDGGDDILLGNGGDDTLYGDAGRDRLYGGFGNDTLHADSDDIVIDGGVGTNTLKVNAGFVSTSDGQIVDLQKVELQSAGLLDLSTQTEALNIRGSGGDDTIIGGAGNDVLSGGDGKDKIAGGLGNDAFKIALNHGVDTIADFNVGEDKLSLERWYPFGPGTLTLSESDSISAMPKEFDNRLVKILSPLTESEIIGQMAGKGGFWNLDHATSSYVLVFNSTSQRTEIWYSSDWSGNSARVKIVVLDNLPWSEFAKLGAENFQLHTSAADPIVLDLDHNGFAFTSLDDGVMFDIDADGRGDQIAWASQDGILALDLDGNGLIDDGSEIFTPDFNGGKFASGVGALASLDTNSDGKIDAEDEAFSKLSIWVDANNNGVSDVGELSSLSENRLASISLTAGTTGGTEDGQTIFSEGSFTFEDGTTGGYVEVGFEAIFGNDLVETAQMTGTDGEDTLTGGMGAITLAGGAGADSFVFDGAALDGLDVADIITDFRSDEGDVLDVTALLDTLLGEDATSEAAISSIRATVDGSDTTVSVQVSDDSWKDVAVLQNHTEAVKILFKDEHHDVQTS